MCLNFNNLQRIVAEKTETKMFRTDARIIWRLMSDSYNYQTHNYVACQIKECAKNLKHLRIVVAEQNCDENLLCTERQSDKDINSIPLSFGAGYNKYFHQTCRT